jgi:hypothetical protein
VLRDRPALLGEIPQGADARSDWCREGRQTGLRGAPDPIRVARPSTFSARTVHQVELRSEGRKSSPFRRWMPRRNP